MANSSSSSGATEIITRVLFVAQLVHVYAIPPLQSNRGHVASVWTSSPQNEIFTARIKIIEESDPSASSASSSSSQTLKPPTSTKAGITTTILLEDANTSELFAGAPYVTPSVVEPTIDSSRFFALRVVGEGGRKAVLGIGFEERSEALDFSIALQEARKILGMEAVTPVTPSMPSTPMTPRTAAGGASSSRNARAVPGRARPEPVAVSVSAAAPVEEEKVQHVKRDWSLKEGQTLHVELGGKSSVVASPRDGSHIQPPSGGGLVSATSGSGFSLLPPPPSAKEVRMEQKQAAGDTQSGTESKTLEELGFDDGEFGEFQ